MPTECSADRFEFAAVEGRRVVAGFDGGTITSDAGALLLGATDRAIGLVRRFAGCFVDHRSIEQVEHGLATLIGQRVFALALGYEDLVDHDQLRHDPVLAATLGRLSARRADCAPLAGKSTLNRLEHAPAGAATRYHRIGHDAALIERLFVDLFLDAHAAPPAEIVLDLDATDDPLHGSQEGRFFHGYYGCYCYLPLYVFCGDHLLVAKLRRSNIDASAGAVEEVARLVRQVRARWPRVRIVLRADSGFARDPLMVWCEANRVDYVLGLARNRAPGRRDCGRAGPGQGRGRRRPARRPAASRTSATRRSTAGVARAGWWAKPSSWWTVPARPAPTRASSSPRSRPRLGPPRHSTKSSTARGARWRTASRSASSTCSPTVPRLRAMRSNQLRLWFASMAYVLLAALRRIALPATRLAQATAGTIRLKLLKIGALVRSRFAGSRSPWPPAAPGSATGPSPTPPSTAAAG